MLAAWMPFLSLVSLQPLKHGCLGCTVQRQTDNYPNVRDFSNPLGEDISFGDNWRAVSWENLEFTSMWGLLTPLLGWRVCDGTALSCGVEGNQGNTSPLAFSLAMPVKMEIVREQLWASPHFTQQRSFGLLARSCLRDSFPSVCNLKKGRVFPSTLPKAATLSLSPRAEVFESVASCPSLLPAEPGRRVSGTLEQQDYFPHSSPAVINPPLGSQVRKNSRFCCCEESETLSQVSPGAMLFPLFPHSSIWMCSINLPSEWNSDSRKSRVEEMW